MRGVNLCKGDYDFRTPLHLAASNGHVNTCQYLIEHGDVKDVNPMDRWKGTPYDDAVRDNHLECVEYLKSVGGMPGDMVMMVNPDPNP